MTESRTSYARADEAQIRDFLNDALPWSDERSGRIEKSAIDLVEKIRATTQKPGALETFLKDYSLETAEGLALMSLAEALLRIPDKATRNAIIRDKVTAANWLNGMGDSQDWVVKAAGVGLMMTSQSLNSALKHVAQPVIRESMIKAMQILGRQFVLGETIEDAIETAKPYAYKNVRLSYDMLGEGARTADAAARYFQSYHDAISEIAKSRDTDPSKLKHGISVKLSALHPRYEFAQKERCIPELTNALRNLALHASSLDVPLTVDAEESERLDLSLEIIEALVADKMLEGWDDFGMAVQAYSKQAYKLIEHVSDIAALNGRRMHIRLVKGAYWDREIKYAQAHGYDDFPVFTRKCNTDLSFLACTHLLMKKSDLMMPMLASHNAHSITAMIDMADEMGCTSFELQRLHGMGESLFDVLKAERADLKTSIYAPVGPQADLLPYLVRRLLENGANSSFVNALLNNKIPPAEIVTDPIKQARGSETARHPKIKSPHELFMPERLNSKGLDLDNKETINSLYESLENLSQKQYIAKPIIDGVEVETATQHDVMSPKDDQDYLGTVYHASRRRVEHAVESAQAGFESWSQTDIHARADILNKIANLIEINADELMALGIREAGKTIPDLHDEIREAVDFCRYYAEQGRTLFDTYTLRGPDGESNTYTLHGRGVFVCISPWNFPIAIFTGQIVAALMAGNSVIAKPAEQTPLLASMLIHMMHKAGIPQNVLHLLPGDGEVGATLVKHDHVAGVAFTGSTGTAKSIQRALASKDGPIVPLIAETGGQNAMIVDSSALTEQVIDDVILSAFGSAGQRCSALRVLYLQDDIADETLAMLKGALDEFVIGDPYSLSSDIGPVIDEGAYASLSKHVQELEGFAKHIYTSDIDPLIAAQGHYYAPCIYEIESITDLTQEHFGPILHVIRYEYDALEDILAEIKETGFALTLGIHSRIESFQQRIINAMPNGNIYVNRTMIGAVVGSQPFGGSGLSGTGPKAGGPHYLKAFATEKTISIDTTAAGGNASLVSLAE